MKTTNALNARILKVSATLSIFAIASLLSSCASAPKGRADAAGIEATILSQREQFVDCFVREMPSGTEASGEVKISFLIETNGDVNRASLVNSTLNQPMVETCLMKRLVGIRFPKPDLDPVEVTYPFRFEKLKGDSKRLGKTQKIEVNAE